MFEILCSKILICVFLLQLYCVNYPSLRDNNTLRRVVVSEVLYWAEHIKNRWMEEKTGKKNDAFTLCQTEGGMEELHFEPHMEMEEKQTGSEMT